MEIRKGCPFFFARLRAGTIAVWALSVVPLALRADDSRFRRGDADANGSMELTDAVRILGFLFRGEGSLPCGDAADGNDDGRLNITDPVFLLSFLFRGSTPPPEPRGVCGFDRTEDEIDCARFPPCAGTSEFEDVAASFGILRTLAGKGEVSTPDENAWQESFEGGPATEAELSKPHNALGDAAGNIYIADKEAHGIRKVTPDGRIFTVAGTNEPGDDGDGPAPGVESRLDEPNGLWVRADGTVYILDTGNGKVRRLDPGGTMTTLFSVPGLRTGRGLWVSEDERLAYVSSRRRLVKWTPGGGTEALPFSFEQLGNLAVDSTGDVIVTDRDAHLVYRITTDLRRIHVAGNGLLSGGGNGQQAIETGLFEVRGVWIHPSTGGFFLATQFGSQIWYVDTEGIIHLFLDGNPDNVRAGDGELFSTPGPKVSNIRSVTMDRQGNLIITENDFGFVRIVKRAGTVRGR